MKSPDFLFDSDRINMSILLNSTKHNIQVYNRGIEEVIAKYSRKLSFGKDKGYSTILLF